MFSSFYVKQSFPPIWKLRHLVLQYLIMTLRGQLVHHPLSLFRLVYIYVQRRNPRIHSHHKCCHHQSRAPELFINNAVSSHQYLTRTHHPKQIWTVENDPIYEDITEVKMKIERAGTKITKETTKAVKTEGSTSSLSSLGTMKTSPSVSSNVQYGMITAKEVAKFVPCTDVNIRRWWMQSKWLMSPWSIPCLLTIIPSWLSESSEI